MNIITLQHHIDIDAAAGRVWSVLADYSLDPSWRTGVVSMEATPPGLVEVGTKTVEHLRLGGRTWRNDGVITEVEAGHRFCWRTTAGADARGSRTVERAGDERCIARLELIVVPRGAERLMAPALGRMLDRNLRGDLRRLRDLVEQRATTPLRTRVS
jgi:uncharacterized membrane protein